MLRTLCLLAAAGVAVAGFDAAAEPDNARPAAKPVLPLAGGLAPAKRSGTAADQEAIRDYYRGPRGEEWS